MILLWIVLIFSIGGALAWASERLGPQWPRVVSLTVLIGHMGLVVALWVENARLVQTPGASPFFLRFDAPWIPPLGIRLSFALDGVGLLLVALSNFLGIMAVATSWRAIRKSIGFFHFNLMVIVSALAGLFMASDLFLFYVFWEVLLVPLFFLIALWGYEARRTYAAIKFFVFTQGSGLLLLLAVLGLHFAHERATGVSTFDYFAFIGTPLPPTTARWLMLGFIAAFAVKLPVVPLHTWLPDAHAEAPTAGSVDLAGLVLKVGAYGFLRFTFPLFPRAAAQFAPVAMALGVAGILYGALQAFGQTDLKRLIAYTSVSHMGFVLLGVFAWNQLALQGVMMVILAHGVSTGALFILAGDLHERIHTRELDRMGGLWSTAPRMGGMTLLFALASLGLPGLGNFVGEILVLVGAYRVSPVLAGIATLGFVAATVYSLVLVERVFFGPNRAGWKIPDSSAREMAILAVLAATLLWLGLYPRTALDAARNALRGLRTSSGLVANAPSGPAQPAPPAAPPGRVEPP